VHSVARVTTLAYCRTDYASILRQLSTCADSPERYQAKARFLIEGPLFENVLTSFSTATLTDVDRFQACEVSTYLLERYHKVMLRDFKPLAVFGDGNCLFRAVSLGLYGTQERHVELRAKAAIEVAMHPEWYDKNCANFCAPFKDDPFIVLPDYVELCNQVSTSGCYVGILCALALSAVCECKIQMYFPPLNASFTSQPLTQCLTGRNVVQGGLPRLTVMWTTSQMPIDATVHTVDINHFVPLLRRAINSTVVGACVSDPSVIECEPCEPSDVCEPCVNDDNEPAVDRVVIESGVSRAVQFEEADDANEAAGDVQRRVHSDADDDADDSDDEFDGRRTKKARVDSGKAECIVPNRAGLSFKANEVVFRMLRDCPPEDVLPEVPRGKKANCCFVVSNAENMQRKSVQQCNRFWDDCGVWDRQKGRNLTSTFVMSSCNDVPVMRVVTVRNGEYCVKKRKNKTVVWQPIVPAPQTDDVVVLHT